MWSLQKVGPSISLAARPSVRADRRPASGATAQIFCIARVAPLRKTSERPSFRSAVRAESRGGISLKNHRTAVLSRANTLFSLCGRREGRVSPRRLPPVRAYRDSTCVASRCGVSFRIAQGARDERSTRRFQNFCLSLALSADCTRLRAVSVPSVQFRFAFLLRPYSRRLLRAPEKIE